MVQSRRPGFWRRSDTDTLTHMRRSNHDRSLVRDESALAHSAGREEGMTDWRDTLKITEEPSKCRGVPCTIFYIREHPVSPGRSYQSTATTRDAAERVVRELRGG